MNRVPRLKVPRAGYRAFAARRQRKLNRRQKKEVKSLIGRNLEKKFVEGYQTSTGITYGGTLLNMNAPATGTGASGRIGDRIKVSSIELMYECIGYDTTNKIRVIIFKWTNDNAVYAPNVTSILSNTYTSTVDAPLAPYNWDNMKAGDFQVCYDKIHALSWNDNAAIPGSQTIVQKVKLVGKRLHNKHMNLNTGAVTGEGMYYILAISDSAIAGHPKFSFISRLIYTDA